MALGDVWRKVAGFVGTSLAFGLTKATARFTLTWAGLTAARTVTVPDASGTLAMLESTQTYTGPNTFGPLLGTTVPVKITAVINSGSVTNKALTSNVATITTSAAHGLAVGSAVLVSGVGAAFNGTFTLTAVTTTTFSYASIAADVTSAASGGSWKAQAAVDLFQVVNNAGATAFSVGPNGACAAVSMTLTVALPATSGGTGKLSYVLGDLLYASSTTGLSAVGVGSAGQVLTVSSGVPAWADAYAVQSARSVLASTFSITGTTGTYQATGCSVTLPVAGTYLLLAQIRGTMQSTLSADFIVAKFRNTTDAADVTNSEAMICATVANIPAVASGFASAIVTVAASKTIEIYAQRTFAGTITTSSIASDTNGRTALAYIRLY